MDKDIVDVSFFTKIIHNELPSLIYKLMNQFIGEKTTLYFNVFCNEVGCNKKFVLFLVVVFLKLELSISFLVKLDNLISRIGITLFLQ